MRFFLLGDLNKYSVYCLQRWISTAENSSTKTKTWNERENRRQRSNKKRGKIVEQGDVYKRQDIKNGETNKREKEKDYI